MSSTSRSRTPVHLALPTSLPPTSLLTQAMVTYCSNIGSAMSCSQVRIVSRSTRPWMRSVQPAVRHARREQRGVDPVELVGGHHDGGQAADRRGQVRLGRERRDGDRRRWDGRSVADRRAPSALDQVPADDPGGDRADTDGTGADEERTAGPVGHLCRWSRRSRRRRLRAIRSSSQPRTHRPTPTEKRRRDRDHARVRQRIA